MERAAQGPRALSLTASMVQQGDQNENWDRDADQPEQNIAHDVPPMVRCGREFDRGADRANCDPTLRPAVGRPLWLQGLPQRRQ